MIRLATALAIVWMSFPFLAYAGSGEDFPSSQAKRVSAIQEDGSIEVRLDTGHLHTAGDSALVFLRIEYDNTISFLPVGYGKIDQCTVDSCSVEIVKASDELNSSNWIVLDQAPGEQRQVLLDKTLKEVKIMIGAGQRGDALALLDEASSQGIPEFALAPHKARLDISQATSPDGLTLEQIVESEQLRKTLSDARYLDVLINIMNKSDWLSPQERLWVIESLPGRSDKELLELLIVL